MWQAIGAFLLSAIPVLKDVATIAGACVAIYVALHGLSTWRRQLVGNAQHELARRLLRSAYKIRDGLMALRNPMITGGESYHALKNSGLSDDDISTTFRENKVNFYVYDMRLKR